MLTSLYLINNTTMKKTNFIISLILTISALSTFSIYALADTVPGDNGTNSATVLANSTHQDADFDGVLNKKDKCPYSPEYRLVRFNANDSITFLGKKITMKEVSAGENGIGVMTFDVDGSNYGVDPGTETSVAGKTKGKTTSPTLTIKGLFSSYNSVDTGDLSQYEGIVILRRGDINISTGCASK